MRYRETKGHLPFQKAKAREHRIESGSESASASSRVSDEKKTAETVKTVPRTVSE